jgi:hypothetical protein
MFKRIIKYLFGYTEKECAICKKMLCISKNDKAIINGTDIFCSLICINKYNNMIHNIMI